MNGEKIKYKIKTASSEEVYLHLKECNNNFIPPLNKKVDLHEYAGKIFEKAVTFEAWTNKTLIGLVAAYFNDMENLSGYITSVSVENNFKGKGIAYELMKNCIEYARQHKFLQITLEVAKENVKAIALYNKFNFFVFENKNGMVQMKLQINNTTKK